MNYTKNLTTIFKLNLEKLQDEIGLFQSEENIWIVPTGVANSAGNLCLHLIGNLNHFIGAGIGHTGYVRHRDAEFADKDVPRQQLLVMINDCVSMIEETLSGVDANDLEKISSKSTPGREMTNGYLLLHLLAHLNYHLGQINYLRRLIEKAK